MADVNTAELLFKINADAKGATDNLRQFRQILSKDLSTIKADFSEWSKKTFGDLGAANAALVIGAAGAAAGMVALGAALNAATERAAQYASQIDDATDKTGLSAEAMSRMRFAAESMGLSNDRLVKSLVFFERAIDAARRGSAEQEEAFKRLGITQKDLEAGAADIVPLYEKVSDAFARNAATAEKTAVATQLFGRGAADMVEFLSIGSNRLREFNQLADQMGRTLTEKDLVAARELKVAQQQLNAQMEAYALVLGKQLIPLKTQFLVLLMGTQGAMKRLIGEWELSLSPAKNLAVLLEEMGKAQDRVNKLTAAAFAQGGKDRFNILPDPQDTKTTYTILFTELRDQLTDAKSRMAQLAGEEAAVRFEAERMHAAAVAAFTKLRQEAAEGKISAETWRREVQALAQTLGLIGTIEAEQLAELGKKRGDAMRAATLDILNQIREQGELGYEEKLANVEREIELRRSQLIAEKRWSDEADQALESLRRARIGRIEREQTEAFSRVLSGLQRELAQIVVSQMTTTERLRFIYEQDALAYSEAEESKALATAKSEEEREIIRQQFQLNREAAENLFASQLTVIVNGRGWRGVFGDLFAQQIRENEELLREWATTADQAMMLVRVSAESLGEMGRRAFANFAAGMAQNVSYALVYRKSIGEAMGAALAATLQTIAAESFVQAIYSTALGFIRLAQHDYVAAGQAFTAAGIFGSVGAAAAIAGRVVAPRQAGAGAGAGGGGRAGGGVGETGGGVEEERRGPRVQITINGNVVGQAGIDELVQIINEAVEGRDVRLVASQVRQPGQATR